MSAPKTEGEKFRDLGFELVLRLGSPKEVREARERRAELDAWPGRRPNLVRPRQARPS